MYPFPKDLYVDVRIEETYNTNYYVQNGDVETDFAITETGAMIRVFDGTMWYTGSTNDVAGIQKEIDNLASLATPNPDILKDPTVASYEVNKATVLSFTGEKDIRNITRDQRIALVQHYIDTCIHTTIPEQMIYVAYLRTFYRKKQFYSSLGSEIVQDYQSCICGTGYIFVVNDIPTQGEKTFAGLSFDKLFHHEEEFIKERDRYLDYARNAVDVVPGNYTCVLAPIATALFTHESFGHKSEADFMLNDKTLQDEWIMGKTVGNEKVSICDSGALMNNGYVPYDDEGTESRETWLIKNGVLTGRLHDAHSAAVLKEELTGNSRAQNYSCTPMVRMTNTYMAAGTDNPEDMIKDITDGIFVYGVDGGTGMSTFTMSPNICYRIRDGKIAEPLRVHVITGNVFQTLFDIDAVGTDFILLDSASCGKNGQSAAVSIGGPTIRVKSLTVN